MRVFILFILIPILIFSKDIKFDNYFDNYTIRVDYYHTGDADEEFITMDQVYKQGIWAGTIHNLIDPFNLGKYFVKVYDSEKGNLIYSKGYSSYFGEYQTTIPAKTGIKKTYHESVLIPCPKNTIRMTIESRDRKNQFHSVFEVSIDPNDYHINNESTIRNDFIVPVLNNGDQHQKVDIVILGEGYTESELEKFYSDLKKYSNILFTIEPFKSNKTKFNISGILRPSIESGADEPTKGRYRNTVLDATFNSLDSPRYLLTENNKTIRDIAAQVPYDLAYIMVNINRYGGGGIYNTLGLFTASEVKWNEYVFVHEFGHFFAALADEYYNSSVAYNEFYAPGVEPTEPNITALLESGHVKWKKFLSPGLPVPTDWGKAGYDSLYLKIDWFQKQQNDLVDSLQTAHVSEEEIKSVTGSFTDSIKVIRSQINNFISDHPLRGLIGVFEGAGYASKGLYRPTVNSIMNKFDEKDWAFYKVSGNHLQKMIDYYCK